MIPLFIPMTFASTDLPARVQRLESALALTLGLLHTLLDRLECKLGPGFLDEELRRLTTDGGLTAREAVAQIDVPIQQGQQPKAARLFRELAGVTWDEVHAAIGGWGTYPFEQKVRWLQLSQWVKALGAHAVANDTQSGHTNENCD